MKAIRVREFGGPEVMKLEEIVAPSPGAGQILVRAHAAGVNPVDTYIRAGTYAKLPNLPYTPGTDAAGIVESVGASVKDFRKGDRVYTLRTLSGACAQRVLCSEGQVFRLPDNISFAQGATLGVPYTTAHRALFHHGRVRPGDLVLVHGGTGGVGLAAVQLAHAAGARVIATGGSEEGRQQALQCGADQVLDHGREGYLDAIPDLTGGRAPDVILEMLANVNLGRDLAVLALGGRVVVIGSRATVEINPRDLMARDASVSGMILWNTSEQELRRIHAALHAGLETGALMPVIAETLVLADAALAHRQVMGEGHRGNIVLEM